MTKKTQLLNLIPEQGIVPLFYSKDPQTSIGVMRALYNAGIRTTEYADRGERALINFKEMRKVCDAEMPGMYLGIGTIKNARSAQTYIDAGAEFVVSPGILEEVVEVSERADLLCIPGCMTPTDLIRAEACGVNIVKLFPANTLGPSYVEAVQAVFSDLIFLPTGGIELNEDNLRAWFRCGVCAVGGSKLITKIIMEEQRYEELTIQANRALNLIQSIKDSLQEKLVSKI